MIQIEREAVSGFEAAIRSMRNPLNSWDKSDSYPAICGEEYGIEPGYVIGKADMELAQRLVKAGTDHSKFMRFIIATADITAPLYMLKEVDTYRMGVEKNSCSTMHTLHKRDLTLEDFSVERMCEEYMPNFQKTIDNINNARKKFIETGETEYWDSMIQNLPSSYNQKRTFLFSYQALRSIYHARQHHKMREWHDFCHWIETLPYAKELICI
jgi:hypothetical protein